MAARPGTIAKDLARSDSHATQLRAPAATPWESCLRLRFKSQCPATVTLLRAEGRTVMTRHGSEAATSRYVVKCALQVYFISFN